MQIGYTRGSRVVPRRKQLGKKPDEAMPSSRGDVRAAERARTGGAKTAPRRDQRISTPLEKKRVRFTSGGGSSEVLNSKSAFRVHLAAPRSDREPSF
jgi:hypothetical protein